MSIPRASRSAGDPCRTAQQSPPPPSRPRHALAKVDPHSTRHIAVHAPCRDPAQPPPLLPDPPPSPPPGTPGPGPDRDDRTIAGLHIPGSGPLYTVLALLQLAAGIVTLIAPYKVVPRPMGD